MKKEDIIKSIVRDVKDYRFTHEELMRMSKKELLQYYPQFIESQRFSEMHNQHQGNSEMTKEKAIIAVLEKRKECVEKAMKIIRATGSVCMYNYLEGKREGYIQAISLLNEREESILIEL